MQFGRTIVLSALFVMMFNAVFSQQYERIIKVGYTAGVPIADLGNYVHGKAFDGLSVDFRYFLTDNVSLGVSTGWNSFSKKYDRKIYYFPNGEISAVQTRYFRSIPILLTAHYYRYTLDAKVIPFVGIGLGGYILHYEKWYGVFPDTKNSMSFGIRPEAGIYVPFSQKVGMEASLKYNYAFYSYQDIKNFNFPEANVGVFFYLY